MAVFPFTPTLYPFATDSQYRDYGCSNINHPIFLKITIMAKKEKRFEVVYKDGSQLADGGYRQILVNKETGVNYLSWKNGYGAGITPLLDSDGKVS